MSRVAQVQPCLLPTDGYVTALVSGEPLVGLNGWCCEADFIVDVLHVQGVPDSFCRTHNDGSTNAMRLPPCFSVTSDLNATSFVDGKRSNEWGIRLLGRRVRSLLCLAFHVTVSVVPLAGTLRQGVVTQP